MPIRVRFNLQKVKDFIPPFIGTLIMLGCMLGGFVLFLRGVATGNSLAAVAGFLAGLLLFAVAAIFFYLIWIRRWIDRTLDAIFGLGRKLKTAPVPLSHLEGLIAHRKLDAARAEIERMMPACRHNAHFVLIVMDFYLGPGDAPEAAWQLGVDYLADKPEVVPEYTLNILMRLDDVAAGIGRTAEAGIILRTALHRNGFPENEYHALERRLAAIAGRPSKN